MKARKRLSFSSRFYGRTSELEQLLNVHDRLTAKSANVNTPNTKRDTPEIVLVGGYAGTGKSQLVWEFQKRLDHSCARGERPPVQYFLHGKFEELVGHDPFSALAEAFGGICEKLVSSDAEADALTRGRIRNAVGEGGVDALGEHLVSGLKKLIDHKEKGSVPNDAEIPGFRKSERTPSSDNTLNRLKFGLQKFVGALCEDGPVILFLDDLQWADQASLDVLLSLVSVPGLQNLLFVGTYRDSEVASVEDHPLSQALSSLRTKGTTYHLINLGDLSETVMLEFVADTLNMEPSEVETLATSIYNKTDGNIFYVIQALTVLEQTGVLSYSFINGKWEWDETRLTSDMSLSDNVIDLVLAKMKTLKKVLQNALTIASFLRSTFEVSLLQEMMEGEGLNMELPELIQLLDVVVAEGFLDNQVGSPYYRFAHDRIKQAARSLIDKTERDQISMRIGIRMMHMASRAHGPDKDVWILFVAADLLNSLPDHLVSSIDVIDLVSLNLEAGELAAAASAFFPASCY